MFTRTRTAAQVQNIPSAEITPKPARITPLIKLKPKNQRKELSQKSKDLQREKWKNAARRKREALCAEPRKHAAAKERERARWHERKANGKVKLMSEMSERERRTQRKYKREHQRSLIKKKQALMVSQE